MQKLIPALLCASVALGVVGCKAQKPDTLDVDRIDGHRRLPQTAAPLRYALDFTIDPASERFSGVTTIDFELLEETDTIRLHAEGLTFKSVTLAEQPEITADVKVGDNGGISVELSQELSPGTYALVFDYDAILDEAPQGLYRVKEQGRWYAFTQFEPLEAREAFPSFDEPGFKTPFDVTIHAPKDLVVAANAPLKASKPSGELVTHEFETTRPLPTYLVALTVGDFDVVEAPRGTIPDVEFRILAPKGTGKLAGFALERTPKILELLTDYFGQPYPFAKLDFVAVPNFSAGAMENVGLVTFRERLLLLDERTATPRLLFASQSVIAHELAHMWFGNLVTPAWWDELWLNEAFATWMATRVLEALDPRLEAEIAQARSASRVMRSDSLAETRVMRQPILTGGDVYNAFDGITYTKGAAVLRMTEAWLGEDAFRDGVRKFMRENAYGTVTTKSLMASLQETSGKDAFAMMQTFTDQPGVPLLEIVPLCSGQAAQLKVRQTRYLPAESAAASTGVWKVPMCVKFSRAGQVETSCSLLTEPEEVIALPGTGCPEWIYPNADEASYFRWSLPQDAMLALVDEHRGSLTMREQLGLLSHLGALVDAQRVDADVYYRAALELLKTQDHHLISDAIAVLRGIEPIAAQHEMQDEYAAAVRDALGPHLERLGLDAVEGESPVVANLRLSLLGMLGHQGRSIHVVANAKGLIPAFLADPDAFPAYRARWALPVAVEDGDRLLWEDVAGKIDAVKTPSGRNAALSALGHFEDPELLVKTLELFFDDRIRSNEFWRLVGPSVSKPGLFEQVTWPWFTANYDKIVGKLGEQSAPNLPYIAGGFCSKDKRAEVKAFFEAPGRAKPGMERNLANVLESIAWCESSRAYRSEAAKKILSRK